MTTPKASKSDQLRDRELERYQLRMRTITWSQAAVVARRLYGDIERDHVLAVLRDQAAQEDAGRWFAALPPCSCGAQRNLPLDPWDVLTPCSPKCPREQHKRARYGGSR